MFQCRKMMHEMEALLSYLLIIMMFYYFAVNCVFLIMYGVPWVSLTGIGIWRIIRCKVLRSREGEEGWNERDGEMNQRHASILDVDVILKSSTIAQTLEDLSLASPEDTLDPALVPGAASTETASNCRRRTTKLSPERDTGYCTTSTKPVLYVCLITALQVELTLRVSYSDL